MTKNDVHLVAILDRSGSMASLTEEMRKGFNSLKADQLKEDGETYITLTLFDNEYERLYTGANARNVPDLTDRDYFARGSTALLDAVGRTVTEVQRLRNLPKKIVVVIATDGFENASKEYTKTQIKDLVTKLETQKNPWTFMFLGVGVDAFSDKFGFVKWGHSINVTADAAGMTATAHAANFMVAAVRNFGNETANTMDYSGMSTVDYGNNPTTGDTQSPS